MLMRTIQGGYVPPLWMHRKIASKPRGHVAGWKKKDLPS